MDNNIGKKLDGRYELLELIGVGGMADIYRAKDVQEDRIVAVKILKTEYAGSEEFLRRFRNESKAIALLSHPNIVKIYDVGFTNKVQFIVMEYVDGITLSDYIEQQGVLKWRDAVHFTVQTLKALQHAHDRGIVHRDIKSSNIMLLRDGTIKVMDFGIARFNRENNKTVSEKTIGSVHYISPEQARGDITDERSDIYSVGVALYEMLTGKKPFDGDTPVAIALMHMQTEPKKPTEINETIPEGLEQIVMKAMQKEPNARYQTALEMITDLEEFKKNPGMVFDYKYNSTDGTPKFAGVNPLTEPTEFRRKKAPEEPAQLLPDDDDDYYYDDDDDIEERRSPLIPILFGVGAAFVIVVVFLILTLVSTRLGTTAPDDRSQTSNFLQVEGGEVTLPEFVGHTWAEVIAQFPDNSVLNIIPDEQYSEEPEGYVFEQEFPKGRKMKVGSSIVLKVSRGIKKVEIQDMRDRTVEAARKQLEKDGFKTTTVQKEDDTIAKDHVISTVPEANTMAQVGSTVTLIVSMGPNDKPFAVPKLVDMPIEEALKRCDEYGLKPTVENRDSMTEKGTVLEQSIEPNTMASKGDAIKLVVSTGDTPKTEKTITIPIPQYASGEYLFKFYVDGALDSDATRTVDVSYMSTKEITYTIELREGDKKQISVKVVYTKTGAEGTYVKMTIGLEDGEVPFTTDEQHSDVFRELQNTSGGTTTPPSDTSSEPDDTGDDTNPGGDDTGTGGDNSDQPADPNDT